MILIPLGKGYFAKVDDCDIDLLYNCAWNKHKHGHPHGRYNGGINVPLYKVIADRMGFDPNRLVDHIHGDRLDCRRCELREATPAQNLYNQHQARNATGFKGVTARAHGMYDARIRFEYKEFHLGCFETSEAANQAYMEAAKQFFGEFANQGLK